MGQRRQQQQQRAYPMDARNPRRADKAVRSTGTLVRREVGQNLIVKQPARISALAGSLGAR